jgi:hypothetical protein
MTEAVKKNGIKFGIIVAVVSILITTIIYTVDPTMFVSIGLGIGIFIINLIIGIYAVITTKKQMGGYIEFKEALGVYVLTMALGAFIGTAYMGILFNLIDPGVKEIISEAVIQMSVKMMQSFGADAEAIRKSVEDIKATDSFSFFGLFKSFMGNLVVTILIGLIVAAATKKNRPYEFPAQDDTNNKGDE